MKAEKVNVFELTKNINQYANFIFGEVNDHVVRAAVIDGDFNWHKHENCDELFLVLDGELFIDFEDGTESLLPGDVYTVKAIVLHRTRSNRRTVKR
jgi:mannose-6-phosphate isomerase-like protein (cupin superfamily)